MRLKLIALVSTLMLMFGVLSLPVKADSGIAFGVIGNMATFDTDGTEADSATKNAGTHSEDVDYPEVFLEYAAQYEHVGMTFGIAVIPGDTEIGAKSRTDTQSDTNESSNDSGTYTAKAEVSDHITIYVEPTVYAGNGVGVFLKAGVSHVTVNTLESITFGTDSSAYGNQSVFGGMTGAGIKYQAPNGLLIKLERTDTVYETVDLDGNNGRTISAQPEQSSTKLSIGYQF